jgi:cytochrome c oxidase subunit 1
VLSERLGRWHFWLSLVGAYGTFLPMHLEGLAGRPRHYAQVTGSTSSLSALLPAERGITWAAFLLAAAQLIFLINVVRSARRGTKAGDNPWRATTLEWRPSAPLLPIERGPFEYGNRSDGFDFSPQWETAAEQE